jgi:hypothetical protein
MELPHATEETKKEAKEMAKNPRKDRRPPREPLYDMEGIVSSNDFTGIAPAPILDESAAAAYAALCAIHQPKPEDELEEKKK